MKIRDRITFQFTGIVAFNLLIFISVIIYISALQRSAVFNHKLRDKALNTVRMLMEVDGIDVPLLKKIRRNHMQSLPMEFVRIYGKSNNVIFKDDTFSFKLPMKELDIVRSKGKSVYSSGDRQLIALTYNNKGGQYIVTASAIDMEGHRNLQFLAMILIIAYFVSLFTLFFWGRFFARNALKPIGKIIDEVRGFAMSEMRFRIAEGYNKDEISMLAGEFNQLFKKVESAFEMQKRFISNASHELRTPLTSIMGEIDVTLMRDRDKEEYKVVLRSIFEEAKKLRKLSNGLLELAYTGIDERIVKLNPINIEDFVSNIKEELFRRNKAHIMTLDFSNIYNDHTLEIIGNEELLLTAFVNVLDNAYKFSNNKPVSIQVYKKANKVFFKITDEGIGIPQKDIDNIFQPFYRSEISETIPGYGIGLSLVNKIVSLHGGEVKIDSEVNKGTSFIISFSLRKQSEIVRNMTV
jgi:two-component system, OmpR family, sensor histidine kinase ArlS